MKKLFRQLHLWLGLLSGVIVIIVCLTGGLSLFRSEIENATEPWRHVTASDQRQITPGQSLLIAGRFAGNYTPAAITIGINGESTRVDYTDSLGNSESVFLNPYNGKVLKVVRKGNDDFNFFDFLMAGHLRLWLPASIGRPLVSYAILIFFITLITGIIISWPKRWNKKMLRLHFTFHRPIRMPRLNWDLHNVLGYYFLLPLLVFCWTGMMFGFDWFSGSVYKAVSGGKAMEAYLMPLSVNNNSTQKMANIDILDSKLKNEEPEAEQFYYALPQNDSDVYRVSVVHELGSYYKQDNRYFDQYNLKELQGRGPWAGEYSEKSAADKMMRMNLDIHEGIILGWLGKAIMFLASLVGASLPITGLIIWRRRMLQK